MIKTLCIVGSLRKESWNLKLAKSFMAEAAGSLEVEQAEIGNLPLFNQDLEVIFPAEAAVLKDEIRTADLIVIVSPEHNRSIPTALKNAIDWTSRPYGDNAWNGKKVFVMGASPGALGTAVMQSHLKQVLLFLNAKVLGQPEFYLGSAHEKFDAEGKLNDDTTRGFIRKAVEELVKFAG